MSEKAMLVENLTKIFKKPFNKNVLFALKNISLSIESGSTVGIIGQNGAGKTTFMKLVMGFLHPTGGTINLLGESPPYSSVIKNKIAYLPEGSNFYENFTGFEMMCHFSELFKRKIPISRVEELLKWVGLHKKKDIKTKKYSKGMLRRLGIAQVLLNDPEFILLDEPLTGLDPLGRVKMLKLIRDLCDEGKTLVYASHHLEEIEELTGRIIIFKSGKIIKTLTCEELTSSGKTLKDIFFDAIGEINTEDLE